MKRFWDKVNKTDGCWNWTANTAGGRSRAYGSVRMSSPRRMEYAHRVSYELANGPIPTGMHVLHSCDNTLCVNPEHLRIGTAADNAQDKVERGRAPRNGAKLSESDIPTIRKRIAAGDLHRNIAADYNVVRATISQIARGANWK